MDPRNWLNDSFIFQFENLAYNELIQTVDGVQKIIANIIFYNYAKQLVDEDEEVIDRLEDELMD